MSEVASRELRNDTRGVLERVERGEQVVITVAGRPVAVLTPVSARRRWVSSAEFLGGFPLADADLRDELRELAADTTDDLRGW